MALEFLSTVAVLLSRIGVLKQLTVFFFHFQIVSDTKRKREREGDLTHFHFFSLVISRTHTWPSIILNRLFLILKLHCIYVFNNKKGKSFFEKIRKGHSSKSRTSKSL